MSISDQHSYSRSHTAEGYGKRYLKTYASGYYFEQWTRLERPILEDILNQQKENGAKRVLDFACGTGRILSVNESIFADSTGFDVSETMLAEARKACLKSRILHYDINKGPLNETFDVVTAFRFIVNADEGLRSIALDAIHSMISEDGVLIVNCHQNSFSFLGIAYRIMNRITGKKKYNTMSFRQFKDVLEQKRFVVDRVYWYSYFPRIGWHFNWMARYCLLPFEWIWKRLPFLPKHFSQSFMVVAKIKN